jgi:hypothetical protein
MNLFILSLCFRECAEWMFDKHIAKMIVEAVQMLSTAKRVLDPLEDIERIEKEAGVKIYKISHKNHPVSIWIRTSLENYLWTLEMIDAMHEEWRFRYGHPETKVHASYKIAQHLREAAPPADRFPERGLTPFAQAMPDEYKGEDAVEAYRRYYQSPDKKRIASWKRRTPPAWYDNL